MTIYERHVRELAADMFERGLSCRAVAEGMGIPRDSVRQWRRTLYAVGREALLNMGSVRTYNWETKVAAASAVVDSGKTKAEAMREFGIASMSPLEVWCRKYREGGPEALRPAPKGRPKGPRAEAATREQELERKVEKLEAQVAYLKKIDSSEGGAGLAARARAEAVAELSGRHRLSDLLECAGLPRSTYRYALSHPSRPTRPELREAGIVQSMSRKGNCLDNACAEGLFGHIKDEFFRGRDWGGFESFRADLEACIAHWNTRRRQAELKGLILRNSESVPSGGLAARLN